MRPRSAGPALYRYWQLEQRLAEQICRLKRQTIQLVDTAPYQHLLSDEHQQAALKMVMQQMAEYHYMGARNRQNPYAGPYYRGIEPDDS